MPDHALILHHYDTSPFSEKIRVMFGLKTLAWKSAVTPNMMPKPDLTPLTGGYRRAPVMQIGADIFCDSQVILAEIERRHPAPAPESGLAGAVNLWADRLFFMATVPIIFGEIGEAVPRAFIEDREKLSGRPFDIAAMTAAAGPLRAQWRAQCGSRPRWRPAAATSAGDEAGLADISAYMNVWFLAGATPQVAAELMDRLTHLQAWRERMIAIGHGIRQEITGAEALEIARKAKPDATVRHDPGDRSGLTPGEAVTVMADDYGRDPIAGALVAATPARIVIERDEPGLGRLHLHFPRVGYLAKSRPHARLTLF